MKQNFIRMVVGAVALASALVTTAHLGACVKIQTGADPLVVQCERTETMAAASFDLCLKVDDANRPFFKNNLPAYHDFCEWLRQPQPIWVTNTVPRCVAMIIGMNDVKRAYKSKMDTSNRLYAVMFAVQEAGNQAATWLNVATNLPGRK